MALTLRSLLFMGGLGAVLIVWNIYALHRDTELATGPKSEAQEAFFVDAAERPDISVFFRKLTAKQRLAMAQNIGRYTDPQLAKLCGTLLGDFDPAARAALAESMGNVAVLHPQEVADQFNQKGSFQQLGISKALQRVGPSAAGYVVKELSVTDARPGAEQFLVSLGAAAVPSLLPLVQSTNQDVQLAAVDGLGKLRARQAVPTLTSLFHSGDPKQVEGALTALAAIGDPASENLMSAELGDQSAPAALRAEAALGLGRIGGIAAAYTLWDHMADQDSDVSDATLTALQICGDAGFEVSGVLESEALKVAAAVSTPAADQMIGYALTESDLRVAAARAAIRRPSLVPELAKLLDQPAVASDGDFADAAIRALESTPDGRIILEKDRAKPELTGFILRVERTR